MPCWPLVVYLMQARMLYLPDVPGRSLDRTPADIGAGYRDVSIETSDGVRLHGWYVPGDSGRVLLFFHGNAGNISHRLESIRQFLQLGLSVLIVDYRGYGQSEGRTTEQGIYRDAEAAWRYLTESAAYAGREHRPFRPLHGGIRRCLPRHTASSHSRWSSSRRLHRCRTSPRNIIRGCRCAG